jgi:hypothetical protein
MTHQKTAMSSFYINANVQPDEQLLTFLERELEGAQLPVFVDRHVRMGWPWADAISRRIEKAIARHPPFVERVYVQ